MISVIVFAIAYMIKGGWLGKINYKEWSWDIWVSEQPKLLQKVLGGKFFAAFLVLFYALFTQETALIAFGVVAAWMLAISPSMGEEAGAIGRVGKWWGDYKEATDQYKNKFMFDRSYGVLKGFQRGAWMGAMFSIVLGYAFVFVPVLSLGFVASHFVMQEAYYRIHGQDSWAYAEPVIGGLIGFCFYISVGI